MQFDYTYPAQLTINPVSNNVCSVKHFEAYESVHFEKRAISL